MKRTAMVLTLVLLAGSAMADGGTFVTGGGRTDDGTGNMGSGCCPASTQSTSDSGLIGSIGGRQDDGGGGTLGSGTRSEQRVAFKQREAKREFRIFGFLLAIFDRN